jgi:hypothetical protein
MITAVPCCAEVGNASLVVTSTKGERKWPYTMNLCFMSVSRGGGPPLSPISHNILDT